MKVSKRDISLLIMLVGILLLVLAYFMVFTPYQEKVEAVRTENESLKIQAEALESLNARRALFMEESATIQEEIQEKIYRFPVDMKEEDMILYMRDIEDNTPTYVSAISMPPFMGIELAPQTEPDQLASVPDIAGILANYRFVNDGKIPDVYSMLLSYSSNQTTYTTTYSGFKSVMRGLSADDDRKSVEQVNMSYDDGTGNLQVSMTLNHFILSGSGKTYTAPTTISSHGLSSIFGSLDGDDYEIY